MFKLDWPTAIGGAVVGYLAKGRVEATKAQFKGIYTGAIENLKEAFDSKDSQSTQSTQSTQTTNGGNTNGH